VKFAFTQIAIVIGALRNILRLITSSNFVGCSTGRSAGLMGVANIPNMPTGSSFSPSLSVIVSAAERIRRNLVHQGRRGRRPPGGEGAQKAETHPGAIPGNVV
jgi:hypothetical protein